MPEFIQTSTGDLINVPNIKKIRVDKNSLVIEHDDGSDSVYPFQTPADAFTELLNFKAILGSMSVTAPTITSIVPSSMAVTGGPIPATVTGKYFISSVSMFLVTQTGTPFSLGAVFVDSTSVTVTVPNSLGVGIYDLYYTDNNGAVFLKEGAFNVY